MTPKSLWAEVAQSRFDMSQAEQTRQDHRIRRAFLMHASTRDVRKLKEIKWMFQLSF